MTVEKKLNTKNKQRVTHAHGLIKKNKNKIGNTERSICVTILGY